MKTIDWSNVQDGASNMLGDVIGRIPSASRDGRPAFDDMKLEVLPLRQKDFHQRPTENPGPGR